jgi:hypothetical protein
MLIFAAIIIMLLFLLSPVYRLVISLIALLAFELFLLVLGVLSMWWLATSMSLSEILGSVAFIVALVVPIYTILKLNDARKLRKRTNRRVNAIKPVKPIQLTKWNTKPNFIMKRTNRRV